MNCKSVFPPSVPKFLYLYLLFIMVVDVLFADNIDNANVDDIAQVQP